MDESGRQSATSPATWTRKVYNCVGFSKLHNFVLWFALCGALFLFTLSRLPYINIYGVFCAKNGSALPGECFYYLNFSRYNIGILLHLGCILPAALLACIQFAPVIRHKAIFAHRIVGYIVLLLSLLGTIGAFMIARRSFGGGTDLQSAAGTLGIMFLVSLGTALVNIKRMRIEEHRAWMLRAWFYAGSIMTMRIILVIAAVIISVAGEYYMAQPCDKVAFMLETKNETLAAYPACASFFSGQNPAQQVLVKANIGGSNSVETVTAFSIVSGMSLWVALAIHAIGIEIYLHLTSADSGNSRSASYQRQASANIENPSRASLTPDPFRDESRTTGPRFVAFEHQS
ncbi:hypothetical protein BX600DRAFT_543963 [Xylariales sp. PMI_506]|nr:hypothetical protein BX600DRAFT_543963 [Xylariales sp. PMI_506]